MHFNTGIVSPKAYPGSYLVEMAALFYTSTKVDFSFLFYYLYGIDLVVFTTASLHHIHSLQKYNYKKIRFSLLKTYCISGNIKYSGSLAYANQAVESSCKTIKTS